MNETYVECMVARKNSPALALLKYLIYTLAAFSAIMFLLGYNIFIVTLIIFGLLCFFVVPGFEIEYEYLYLDREISIDKILSKQKRKKVRTLELSKMEFICPKNSHQLDPYKARNVKTADFSSRDPEAKVWALLYKDQNGEEIVLLEANEEMIKAIKNVYPRKVIEI